MENNRVYLSAPDISGRERELVMEAFDTNYVAPAGPMLERFEADMTAYTGFKYGVAVSTGTAALHLILRVLEIGAGDEVWTCSGTFIGGVSPVTFVGATPVFFDNDRQDWTTDCQLMADELDHAAIKGTLPAAIVTTDLYGQACDLDVLVGACEKHNVPLVSDSAEALGCTFNGKHAGKGSLAAVVSFNGNKIITTSGGGMVLTDDKEFAEKIRYFATQARQPLPYYHHEDVGYNYRMSNILAGIGIAQLEMIEQKVQRRRDIFDLYCQELGRIEGITMMPSPENRRSSHWLSCMLVDPTKCIETNSIVQGCEAENVEVRPMWKPMHMQPIFEHCRYVGDGFSEELFRNGVCLPSGSGMPHEDQVRVIEVLKKLLG